MHYDINFLINSFVAYPPLRDLIKVVLKNKKQQVSIQHLVIKSDVIIDEILKGDLSKLCEAISSKPYLCQNEIFESLKGTNRKTIHRNRFESWDDIPIIDSRATGDNRFSIEIDDRVLMERSSKYDCFVTNKICLEDPSTKDMPDEFCSITYHHERCGEECIVETTEFRQLWLVLLWVCNLSGEPVKIGNCSGKMYYPNVDLEYRNLGYDYGEQYDVNLPLKILQSGESLLIPEFILMAPLEEKTSGETEQLIETENVEAADIGYAYSLSRPKNHNGYKLIGPSLSIKYIQVDGVSVEIHDFDPNNLLIISHNFYCGSCPHLLGIDENGIHYIKEILLKSPDIVDVEKFRTIIIAEQEDEITYIEKIICGDKANISVLVENLTLNKGEHLIIEIPNGVRQISILGNYQPRIDIINNERQMEYKYRLISSLSNKLEQKLMKSIV